MSKAPPHPLDQRRILHVFPSFEIGGAQARFARIVAGLGDQFRHTVISLSGRSDAVSLLAQGAPVDCIQLPRVAGGLPGRLVQYVRFLSRSAPDVVVTYNWGAIEVALANLAVGVPHVHVEDGFGPEEAHRQFRRRVWGRRVALRQAEVVVPSRTLRDIALGAWRIPEQRLHYIQNGIANWASSGAADAALPTGKRVVRVIWVGALRREKNPLRLLRAFASAPRDAALVIVGDGPERAAAEAEVDRLGLGARCRFLGRRPDVRDLMRQCDILALSSDTEQMPIVVLEAMEAGLPIASTDVGDIRATVSAPNAAFVKGRSDLDLAASISVLVADPTLRAAIGQANRARVLDAYREADMVEAYRRLFSPPAATFPDLPASPATGVRGAGLA